MLSDEKAREVLKSVVGYIRISVAAMSPAQLEPLLPPLIAGLMSNKKGLARFRSKIKIILKVLVRRYGYDAIAPLVPENDSRLLTHMRKLAERATRRKLAHRQDGHRDNEGGFDGMMESDEEDSDDGRTLMTGLTRMTGATLRSVAARSRASAVKSTTTTRTTTNKAAAALLVHNEGDGEVMDMLDGTTMAKNVRFAAEPGGGDFDFDDDDSEGDGGAMEFDAQGRLVVKDDLALMDAEEYENHDTNNDNDEDEGDGEEDEGNATTGGKRRRTSKFEDAKAVRANKVQVQAKQKQKQKRGGSKELLGAAYRSKKAGGDTKKKGQKYEPYAFVPLDGKSYTKKKRGDTVAQMATVVRGKKGASKRKR